MNSVSRRSANIVVLERYALPAVQSRSRETRARIIAAAEKEFGIKGYDGATLAGIAARAGCSVGTVYFRFKDKSALFLAVAEEFVEDAREGITTIIQGSSDLDPEYVIRQFVVASAWNYRRHKGMFRAVVERGIEQNRVMRPVLKWRDELAESLEAVLKKGGLRNCGLKVRVMMQMVYGFLLTGVVNPRAPTDIGDARAISELADACVAYMLGSGK